MHANHRIFVNLPAIPDLDKKAVDHSVRNYAEEQLRKFEGKVFDYFDFVEDEHPIIYGRDCGAGPLLDMLKEIHKSQQAYVREMCDRSNEEYVSRVSGKSFEDMCLELLEVGLDWYLEEGIKTACGEYSGDSMFYDMLYCTAKVTQRLINNVTKTPENWAVVTVNIHY